MASLISIVEIGGYPDFTSLYQQFGYQTEQAKSVRKAIALMKKNAADIIVAEFNFQSDFRDRTSNLETLLATIQGKYPQTRVIVMFEREYQHAFARLQDSYPVDAALRFPVTSEEMEQALSQLQTDNKDTDAG